MDHTDHYPVSCAFCEISTAYPPDPSSPVPHNPDPNATDPSCFLLLSTDHVLAFLDILPISPGHILLTTRQHYRTLADLDTADNATQTAAELGRYLPILSRALRKATGIEDWNVVQNNGARAAQVVPHVHFHLIPRYQEGRLEAGRKGHVDVGMLKSWRMFGRGAREDLDEEEAQEMARRLRGTLGEELQRSKASGSKL